MRALVLLIAAIANCDSGETTRKNKRTKRGLAKFIGDISKTLFDTLSEQDLDSINNEKYIKNIYGQ